MRNPRLAGRYAKSVLDLAIEQNSLEQVYKDMMYLKALCASSRELVVFLKSPVVKADKKNAIIKSLTQEKVSVLTSAFLKLMIDKGREAVLPEIADAFITQYKTKKEIYNVQLVTAVPVSEEVKQQFISLIKQQTKMQHIELEALVDENLIGGFKLEIGDSLVDASVAYDLRAIRKQFMNNDYIFNVR